LFTDSPFEMIQTEGQHRDHAIVEQVFADWNDGPLAHLPSGHFPANAGWLTLAAVTCNLTRAAGTFHAKARGATIRRQLISVAARIARRGRGHPPARRLAPPARLDDPVRGRLRAARRRGLTRPDPVTAQPRPSAATRQQPRGEDPDKPQNTPAAGTPHPKRTPASSPLAATENQTPEFTRRIEAKVRRQE
jgi:hypothetical protein